MTPKASADQGGGVEATAREIVDHCPRCSRLLSRPDSDRRDVYECPGCGRWWQISPLTTQEAIAAALRPAPPSGLTPPRPHDAPLHLPADRSARIARALAADDAEVSVAGAATPPEGGLTPDVERVVRALVAEVHRLKIHLLPDGDHRDAPKDCPSVECVAVRAALRVAPAASGEEK